MTGKLKCQGCRDGASFELPITMAFQPILDFRKGEVFAYEALLRGVNGEGAGEILSTVNDSNRYAFDQRCRSKAIELASELGLADTGCLLSINFLPNAVYEPRACIKLTLEIAEKTGFPIEQIMFEFTEAEHLDTAHILNILQTYQSLGFKTAIDDFGAGFAGLDLLTRFQPDVVKLDMELTRNINVSEVKHTMVRHISKMLMDLGVQVICEGIETEEEFEVLQSFGIDLVQGYYFAKPKIEALPPAFWPEVVAGQTAAR